MASRRACILAGLPADGSLPIAFGGDSVRDGLTVEFAASDDVWLGRFALGTAQTDSVIDEALYDLGMTNLTLVVARGSAYLLDVETRMLAHPALTRVDAVLSHADGALTLSDGSFLYSIKKDGRILRSDRIAWNSIRALCEIDGVIHGEAYSPAERDWNEFQLDRS